jgi:hypothetical protein
VERLSWLRPIGRFAACLINLGIRLVRETIFFVITLAGFCTSNDVLAAQ